MNPGSGGVRGREECVPLLEELWLPVSVLSQAAVNKHRGGNIHAHTPGASS